VDLLLKLLDHGRDQTQSTPHRGINWQRRRPLQRQIVFESVLYVKIGQGRIAMPDTADRGRTAFRLRAQMIKGGQQVRRDNDNYRTAYLMCVLYAFVVIVLAAVFLL
jgi:hypothetical protein